MVNAMADSVKLAFKQPQGQNQAFLQNIKSIKLPTANLTLKGKGMLLGVEGEEEEEEEGEGEGAKTTQVPNEENQDQGMFLYQKKNKMLLELEFVPFFFEDTQKKVRDNAEPRQAAAAIQVDIVFQVEKKVQNSFFFVFFNFGKIKC